MKRIIGVSLSALVLSVLAAPNAHAIRPELLPTFNQPTQSIDRVQETKPQPKLDVIGMKPAQTQSAMKAEKPAQTDESTFELFEQLYHDTYGS
jgi:hypothetical protein